HNAWTEANPPGSLHEATHVLFIYAVGFVPATSDCAVPIHKAIQFCRCVCIEKFLSFQSNKLPHTHKIYLA
ncbi:MAG: hypothetical protein ACRDHW_23140, partial [Ktedonobacteraceae bacterium]